MSISVSFKIIRWNRIKSIKIMRLISKTSNSSFTINRWTTRMMMKKRLRKTVTKKFTLI